MRQLLPILLLICTSGSVAQNAISAKVQMYRGKPAIFINETPVYPMIYSLTDVPGGRWTWEELPRYNLKSFCALGVKLVQVDVALDHVWREDGTITVDTVKQQIRGAIDVCPGSAIFIRLHVNPPKWWQKKHSDENTVYADRAPEPDIDFGIQRIIEDDEETPTRHSIASEKWKSEAGEKVVDLLKQLSKTDEGKSLAGIQVAGGVYGEWHYWGFIENEPDLSEPMRNYFRRWLQAKYKTEKAFQQAWGNSEVKFATASIPDTTKRFTTMRGVFRDPAKERNVIDYYEAQHDLVADAILHFCGLIKSNWPRPIITGAFYGYFYSVFGREAAGGHLQLQKILASKDIDYLSAPGTYYPAAVEMGDPYRSRSLINSMALHGKLWLDEMDQQPPLKTLKDKDFSVSLQKSIAQVRRNVFFTFSKGQGLWFYDFGPSGFNGGQRLIDHGSWGWWDEPSLRKDIKKLKEIFETRYQEEYTSSADVLLVHDTESYYHLGSSRKESSLMHWTNNWPIVSIFKSGVVHDVIHLDDLELTNLDHYKAIVFVNTVVLDDAEKKIIKSKVAANGRHLIWVYAPGYSDGKTLSESYIQDVTGLKVRGHFNRDNYKLKFDSSISKKDASIFGSSFTPVFTVDDPTAVIHGKLAPLDLPGFVSKISKNSTTWYLSIAPDDPELWRFIFKKAGAHIYLETNDIVYEGAGLLAIHSATGGEINLNLVNKTSLKISVAPNSTTILDTATGEIVLK